MNAYKLSANTIGVIAQFLKEQFDFDWNGTNTPQMLNETDCFVLLPQTEDMPGLHFDIQTKLDLTIPEGITQHFPTDPKHNFA
jgi:hypothetical protein